MKIIPRNDFVLVKLDSMPEAVAIGGFGLPDDSVKERQRATVLAVGSGRLTLGGERISINLLIGTKVWLFPGAGQKFNDNEDLLLIKEELIIGVIQDGV